MNQKANNDTMQKLVSLCKRRGFIFPGSEIYGGLANSWDYGPLGVTLKNNVKQGWWRRFVQQRLDMVGIDAALIMNPKVWEASGHLAEFTDPLVECKKCHSRYRADHLPLNKGDFDAVKKKFLLRYVDTLREVEDELADVENLSKTADLIISKIESLSLDAPERDVHLDVATGLHKMINEKLNLTSKKIFISEVIKNLLNESKKFIGLITQSYLNDYVPCESCGKRDWSIPQQFNMMLKTFLGPSEDSMSTVYFRPETAQAMFVDFKQVLETSRKRLPFGIAQIGKAFRNEITPGNFIFRTREFEQMEIEYFVRESEWEAHFEHWLEQMRLWLADLGVKKEHIHEVEIPDGERAHYSKRTVDFEYDYPFGQKELYGLAYRGDFDLQNHAKASGQDMNYTNPEDPKDKFVPHVIEPTWGVDRSVLVALLEAYHEEAAPTADEGETEARVVLKFPSWLAPVKVAILPLSKKAELSEVARPLYEKIARLFPCDYDETQSIGKRYRRQDEIGTPYCVTVDFETLNDQAVTVRERDSMSQERIAIAELESYLKEKLSL